MNVNVIARLCPATGALPNAVELIVTPVPLNCRCSFVPAALTAAAAACELTPPVFAATLAVRGVHHLTLQLHRAASACIRPKDASGPALLRISGCRGVEQNEWKRKKSPLLTTPFMQTLALVLAPTEA